MPSRRIVGAGLVEHDFDPVRDVRFKGRPLTKLDRDELLEALVQALWRLRELETPVQSPAFRPVTPARHASAAQNG